MFIVSSVMLWPLHDKLCVRCGDFAVIRHMFFVRATDKLADGSVSLGYPSWHRFWERLTCFACGLLRSTPSASQLDGYPYRLRPGLVLHIADYCVVSLLGTASLTVTKFGRPPRLDACWAV